MTRRLLSVALVLSIAIPAGAERHRAARVTLGISEVRRVFVVILENADATTATQQPFLSELARRGALLTNYHALTHPSQPNYIAMTAGSAYGISDDNPVTIDVPNLGDLLDGHAISWKVYAEDYPGNCFAGPSSGDYVRRHVPFLDYADVQWNAARCEQHILNASAFDADLAASALPQFALYVPNTLDDGHDTSVATADAWLQSRFGSLIDDPQFMYGTLFVVVFDEGSDSGSNLVYCSLTGAGIAPGASSGTYYNHYDLLRTIEEIFRIGTLHHHDDSASVIDGIWRQ